MWHCQDRGIETEMDRKGRGRFIETLFKQRCDLSETMSVKVLAYSYINVHRSCHKDVLSWRHAFCSVHAIVWDHV